MLKKFNPLLRFLLLLNVFFSASTVLAQNSNGDEIAQEAAHEIEVEKLVDVKKVVFQLRKSYGIEGSVLLTKTLWEILNSYSSQEQAQNLWQSSIGKVTELSKGMTSYDRLNPQFNAGRVLIDYTHGMTRKKWNTNRKNLIINRKNIKQFLDNSDDLTIYFSLNQLWTLILEDIVKQEDIQWHEVFDKSLSLFVELPDATQAQKEDDLVNIDNDGDKHTEIDVILNSLLNWSQKDLSHEELADILFNADSGTLENYYFIKKMSRFLLNRESDHYLSISQNWFELADALFLIDMQQLTQPLFEKIQNFIEINDVWFLSKEQQLMAINTQLPLWLENSFHRLKLHYRNNGVQEIAEELIPSAYQMIDPGFDKYMQIPFRAKILKDLEVCLNISEEYSPFPQLPIDEKQFRGCINDLTLAATKESNSRELSGSLTKIDSEQALDRALMMPSWQNINIIYAYLAKNACIDENENQHLPNPLEWTLAAESLLWFADRWPAYIRTYPQDENVTKIIEQGQKLIGNFSCLDKPAGEILNDYFLQIYKNWQDVKAKIQNVVTEFSHNNLTKGSDLNLLTNSDKPSNYRVENMKIAACDAQNSCGVHVELEASRALFSLFPNHLLVADQLKQGKLKICYDDVGWEQRRAASTHLDNDNVANYYGKFSFTIKGYYQDQLVFNRKLTDTQEYLYLFAANTNEVLNTYCPLSIVGEKISTSLKRGTFGLVPNRLTFLTASRADESKIVVSNWKQGEEWKDKIISDQVNVVVNNELIELKTPIQKAYQSKAIELQDTIYQVLLGKKQANSDAQKLLSQSFLKLQRSVKLFKAINYFLQADELMLNDNLQGMFFGKDKLPSLDTVKNNYENQVNIKVLLSNIDKNNEINQNKWNAIQDNRSNSHIQMILYRLKSLY